MSFSNQELEEFKTESLDLLDHAEKSLLSIDKEGDFPKIFDSIFRCFHNLKGASGMMEMSSLQAHVHELETILMPFKTEPTIPTHFVHFFLKGIDAAKNILDGHQISFSYAVDKNAVDKNNDLESDPVTEILRENEISKEKNQTSNAKDLQDSDLSSFVAEFFSECEEIIDRVATILSQFEKEIFSKEDIECVYRDIHSLKGTAFLFSYEKIGNLAHEMESAMEPFRDSGKGPPKEIVDLLFKNLKQIEDSLSKQNQLPPEMDRSLSSPGLTNSLTNNSTIDSSTKKSSKINLNNGVTMIKKEITESLVESKNLPHKEKEIEVNSTIRVAVSLLDNLMTLMGEMVLVRNQVLQFSSQSEDLEFLNLSKRLNVVTSEIQGEMMKTRMQPIGNILSKYNRVVHDISTELKKEITLNLHGSDTELDKSLLESIKDPLTHIVRNSCDHGIELPELRIKLGKPKMGTIEIKAYHEGGQVVIEVIDDGKGLNKEVLTKKAIEKGIITTGQVPSMTEKEIFHLIFAPGFSTAANITNLSGRGVGMDVVRTNVERIGGSVELESTEGKGSTIRLRIPLTLAIVPALIIKSGGETFAIPQIKLEELVRVENHSDTNKIEFLHGVPVYRLRGQILPLVNLNTILKLNKNKNKDKNKNTDESDKAINIAVLNADKCSFGLIVDEILDTADIVVKPINRLLKSLQVYSGATILGDGSIALILDVVGISKATQIARDKGTASSSEAISHHQSDMTNREFQEFLIVGSIHQQSMPLL